jgi:hypothetical protein
MKLFIKERWTYFKRNHCAHIWEQPFDGNDAKRCCSKCGREQWIFKKCYPNIGEPTYGWETMYESPISVLKMLSRVPR